MKKVACVYDIVLNGDVIYVGMTGNPKARMCSHRYTGVAHSGAKMVIHRWYETRAEAYSAETERQDELKPARSERYRGRRLDFPKILRDGKKAMAEFNEQHTMEDVAKLIEGHKKAVAAAAQFEREWKAKNQQHDTGE